MFQRQATVGHIVSLMIVEPEPPCGIVLHHTDRFKLVLIQPAEAHRAIVTLDVGILLWIT